MYACLNSPKTVDSWGGLLISFNLSPFPQPPPAPAILQTSQLPSILPSPILLRATAPEVYHMGQCLSGGLPASLQLACVSVFVCMRFKPVLTV